MQPSAYWGKEPIWDGHSSIHNAMMDSEGACGSPRGSGRRANPDFCKKGSDHPSAKVAPQENSARQVSVYDPKTGKWAHVDTCFSTHHLYFGHDANKTLWLSAGGPASGVVGWVNTKLFLETGDSARSQGWTPIIVDTNGNGRRDEGDTRLTAAFYGIMPSPVDNTIWGQSMGIGFAAWTSPATSSASSPGPTPPRPRSPRSSCRPMAPGARAASTSPPTA